jgi:uncharacterized protein (DUF1330 family)
MGKAYWVNTFRSVSDPERLAAYVELAGPAMREAGGRFLARGEPARAFESGVIERTVVIEFESVDQAVAAYESPGYQAALRALGDGAERDLRIVEAVS